MSAPTDNQTDIPGISILQDIEVSARYVAYLKDTESIALWAWYKATGDTITNKGMNMVEVAQYDDATGATKVVGFPRVQKRAYQSSGTTYENLTGHDDAIREVDLCMRGQLWRKNVSAVNLEILDPISPATTGVQPTASGRYRIGKTLMPIPTLKWGLCYVDLLTQEVVA